MRAHFESTKKKTREMLCTCKGTLVVFVFFRHERSIGNMWTKKNYNQLFEQVKRTHHTRKIIIIWTCYLKKPQNAQQYKTTTGYWLTFFNGNLSFLKKDNFVILIEIFSVLPSCRSYLFRLFHRKLKAAINISSLIF